MIQCSKCGNVSPDGTTHCLRCGAPMATPPPFNQRPYGQAPAYPSNPSEQKSRIAAGLFAILLGSLGVQYFYCGKIAGGFIAILLSLVTCGIFNVLFLIQGIFMLTMDDAQFYRKYVDNTSTFPLF